MNVTYDMIIAGGGIMGASTAYHLMKAEPRLRLAVVERDPSYSRSSTPLSVGNIRVQFSLRQNILISLYTLEVLDRFEEEMAVEDEAPAVLFRPEGNLFLVDPDGEETARKAYALQRGLRCDVEWWAPAAIRDRYPLYRPAGYVGATFGARDGHLDPYGFLMAYRRKARAMGASWITGCVREILIRQGRVRGVALDGGRNLTAPVVVNCTGAWAAETVRSAGVQLPIVPVKRQVYSLKPAVQPAGALPLTVLPSGLYFRSETGGLIVLGKSMADDPKGMDFSWDKERFVERLWPELVRFVPAFERLKVMRGWAGLYAVNRLDSNAVLGPWPELEGLYLANGFSGHGLQQAPAVGRYLSERILSRPVTLDLSVFSPNRILENRPLSEGGIV